MKDVNQIATIDDINQDNALYINLKQKKQPTKHSLDDFFKVEEMKIKDFMYNVLPVCKSIEAFILNRYERNLVSLVKPTYGKNFKTLYNVDKNNTSDSEIKSSVRSQGGGVDGVLRFSIMWAGDNEDDSDLDAHCQEDPGHHIYYSNKVSPRTGGELDIDIINPQQHKRSGRKVVENITFPEFPSEKTHFDFYVKNYSNRGSKGFKAEIEYMGVQYQYEYPHALGDKENIYVASIVYENGSFKISHTIEPYDGYDAVKVIGGNLNTNHFHKIKLITNHPNSWNNTVENDEFLFFLDDCSIFSTENELGGIGFKLGSNDDLILRLEGYSKNLIKIKF